MQRREIIGIAGAFGSGKSTAAEIISSLGYQKISLAQFLEEELVKRGVSYITRKQLQDLGNDWRQEYGGSVLAEKALALADEKNWDKIVIEGFRNPQEIKRLRQEKDFCLISLVVNRQIRFERLLQFKRREDLTKELFDTLDDRDLGIGENTAGLQTAICVAMADIFIENNESLSALEKKLKHAIIQK